MISFEIKQNGIVCAIVGIDKETENIGYMPYDNEELNTILSYLVDEPYLLITSGDDVGQNHVKMEERIGLNDERFYEALKSQLVEYQFTAPSKQDICLQDFFDQLTTPHNDLE